LKTEKIKDFWRIARAQGRLTGLAFLPPIKKKHPKPTTITSSQSLQQGNRGRTQEEQGNTGSAKVTGESHLKVYIFLRGITFFNSKKRKINFNT
jgi:hypothetical protein